jgi:hypothetical protein
MAGVLGVDPKRLFSLTFREFINYSKGVQKRQSREENHSRRIAWILTNAHHDPKKPLPRLEQFWSIPIIDEIENEINEISLEQARLKKEKLLKAWIKQN